MSVISDAKLLLKHAKRWTRDEEVIDRKLKELKHHKVRLAFSKTSKEVAHHTRRYHITYRTLAKLVADKRKIEYDIHKIQREIRRELARRRKAV